MNAACRSASIAAAFAFAFAACAVDQQKEVDRYRQVLDAEVPRVAEYTSGEELSLRRALALCNQNNERIAIGGEDYVQALIQRQRIADSFLPTLSFAPSYTVEDMPSGRFPRPPLGFRSAGSTAQRFEAPADASVNVFRGFGDVASLHAAEAIVGQRRDLLLDLQASVLVSAGELYYAVLRAERSLEVLRGSLALQESRLADVEQRLANGLATRLSVAQTRAEVDATRATLVQVEGDRRNARLALAEILGVPTVDGALTDEFSSSLGSESLEDCEKLALERRQDLRAAGSAVEASRRQVEAATASYWPSIGLDLEGFLHREDYADATRWSAILSLHLPIFSAGRIEADVRDAWSRLRQAAMFESQARRVVIRDVGSAHNDLATADRRLHEIESEVAAAADALQQARDAFDHDLATNLDVLTAQDRHLSAQLDLTDAKFDRTVAILRLLRATGRLQTVLGGPPGPERSR